MSITKHGTGDILPEHTADNKPEWTEEDASELKDELLKEEEKG